MPAPEENPADRPSETPVEHLVYDRVTGAVLYRYSLYRAGDDQGRPSDRGEVLALATQSADVLDRVTGHAGSNLEVLVVDDPSHAAARNMRVDPPTRRLVPIPRLQLAAERRKLEGDGEDSVRITVTVADADGAVLRDRSDTVKVTTTRGKLSSSGGLVELREGVSEITLRSVRETVAVVSVSAQSLTGDCSRGTIDLEFL